MMPIQKSLILTPLTLSFNLAPSATSESFPSVAVLCQNIHAAQHSCVCLPGGCCLCHLRNSWQKHGEEQAREPSPGKRNQEQGQAQHLLLSHTQKPHHAGPDMHDTDLCLPLKDFSLACCLSLQSHISSLDLLSLWLQSLSCCCYLPQLCQCSWQPDTVPCVQRCVKWAGLVKNTPLPLYLYHGFKTKTPSSHLCSMSCCQQHVLLPGHSPAGLLSASCSLLL